MTDAGYAFQANFKLGDDMVNVRGDDEHAFMANLDAVADGVAEKIMSARSALYGAQPVQSSAQAVANVQAGMPGSRVVADGQIFAFGELGTGANSPREDQLAAKGFVPDKWHSAPDEGGFWHPQKFEEAPACQCTAPKPNHGKLALKAARSQQGKPYQGWFCVNSFNKGAKAGCASSFNGPFPVL